MVHPCGNWEVVRIMRRTVILQLVNLFFGLTPLTRWYALRSHLLQLAGVQCSSSARVVASARIVVTNVSIGDNTFIGHQVLITGDSDSRIVIEDNVDIAPRVVVLTGTHEIDMSSCRSAGRGKGADVNIESGAWIGANCTILPGVRIGRMAVIGAGSVVTKDVPPFCIAVGNPCRVKKKWNGITNAFELIGD